MFLFALNIDMFQWHTNTDNTENSAKGTDFVDGTYKNAIRTNKSMRLYSNQRSSESFMFYFVHIVLCFWRRKENIWFKYLLCVRCSTKATVWYQLKKKTSLCFDFIARQILFILELSIVNARSENEVIIISSSYSKPTNQFSFN